MSDFKTWGERLFYPDRMKKGRKGKDPKKVSLSSGGKGSSNLKNSTQFLKERLKGIVENRPQVMVKITGGNHSKPQMKAHIDYISRNGNVELENENGEIISGKLSQDEINQRWGDDDLLNEEGQSKFKQNYHIVFSMPEGTDRTAFSVATKETIHKLFGENHQFFMAQHDDTDKPHIHVCVKAIGFDGRRLSTHKADLQEWREVYAETLREHGIQAEATKRVVRGNFKKAMPSKLRQMEDHNPNAFKDYQKRDTAQMKKNAREGKPYEESRVGARAKQTSAYVKKVYGKIIEELEKGNSEDRQLADGLKEFVGKMDKIQPKAERVHQEERKKMEKEKKSKDVTR